MHSTLKPKEADDPHDVLVVSSDVVPVAPANEQLSSVLQDAARLLADAQKPKELADAQKSKEKESGTGSDVPASPPVPADPPVPPVPPVDITFRPAAVDDILGRRSLGQRVIRAFTALLLAACIGVAALAWQFGGGLTKKVIGKWVPQLVLTSSALQEKLGLSAPPAPPADAPAVVEAATPQAATPEAAAAQTADTQTAAPAQNAPESAAPAAAPPPETTPSPQSMARDLASLGQEVEQLKASIDQLKAGQQQMSLDIAKASGKASEQNLRPRISAPERRPAVARAHKPVPPYPLPQTATARALPQAAASYPAAAPYYPPRQPEPLPATTQPQPDPELSSVPRPPMPVQ
jgi:hypothetical protein